MYQVGDVVLVQLDDIDKTKICSLNSLYAAAGLCEVRIALMPFPGEKDEIVFGAIRNKSRWVRACALSPFIYKSQIIRKVG